MLFFYRALDSSNKELEGSVDAINADVAVAALQRRGLVVTSIRSSEKKSWIPDVSLWQGVPMKDVVVLSRQISTLFEAQVSALRIFRLLASEATNVKLGKVLTTVADDLQGGSGISKALEKHPEVFSSFYSNMVKAGEESGKLDQTFLYLADYLDRNYEITSKAKNAMIYPAFVIFTFVTVMVLMLTLVIPKLTAILEESGQAIPLFTQAIIALSKFLVNYSVFILIALVVGGFFLFRWIQTDNGKLAWDRFKISIPYMGDLFRKLYLSRIADNFNTMLTSGIPILRAIEITTDVVDNEVYKGILREAHEKVKGGRPLSETFTGHPEIPGIMVAMVKVGEESGEMGAILQTLAKFYAREVRNAVDTLVDLIEPVLIVALGVGVGILLAAVLVPIYNVSSGIQ